jgi:hypothetical protein
MAKNPCCDRSCTTVVFSAALAVMGAPGCQSETANERDDEAVASLVDETDPVAVRPRDDDGAMTAGAEDGAGATPAENEASDAPVTPNVAAPGGSDSAPPVTAQTFAACTNEGSYGSDCDIIYVTMKQTSPSRCIQLNIDNCGGYNQQGLPVDVPVSWRLASGSIGLNFGECELGVFYSDSDVVVDASGSISWNEATRLPSELVLELTLEPSSSAADTTSVEVVTSEPLNPSPCAAE